VLELSDVTDFRSFALPDPYRIVVDIPALTWSENALAKPAGQIEALKLGQYTPDIARLVIQLNEPHLVKSSFLIPAGGGEPTRLVVDFMQVSLSDFNDERGRIHGTLPPPSISEHNASAPISNNPAALPFAARKPSLKAVGLSPDSNVTPENIPLPAVPPQRKHTAEKPLIMLDAGHGGIDSGAVNGNIREKDITLSMVRTLRKVLEQSGRYRVQLTRNSDIYLKLYERRNLATRADADLFISIHADSIHKSNVRGASIYTLSDKASDVQTAKLAARENKADLISGLNLDVEDEDVASILIDLSMRETMNQSKYFANAVVDGMGGHGISLLQNPHRFAGFAVLKSPDIPSVLVEIGFVSNTAEAKRLMQADHQQKIAQGILKGIDRYFDTLQRNTATE
jgi:N-acetylmuramoyl-L-alanine amidase